MIGNRVMYDHLIDIHGKSIGQLVIMGTSSRLENMSHGIACVIVLGLACNLIVSRISCSVITSHHVTYHVTCDVPSNKPRHGLAGHLKMPLHKFPTTTTASPARQKCLAAKWLLLPCCQAFSKPEKLRG